MSFLSRTYPRVWILVVIVALGSVAWVDARRVRHIDALTAIGDAAPAIDSGSQTGYVDGVRQLVAPGHNNENYQWIIQTQSVLEHRSWRLRHVEYDNAPFGRDLSTSSPYRWWLGLLASCHHRITGAPLGVAVERASLYAEPALHALILTAAACFTAFAFGWFPAVIVAIGFCGLFPLGAAFQPGQPDDFGLSIVCAFFTVAPLLAAIKNSSGSDESGSHRNRARWLFVLSGLAGGVGIWINPARQVIVLAGLIVGAALAALTSRPRSNGDDSWMGAGGWRGWGIAGAATILVGFLVEFGPTHLADFRLQTVHPLHGLICLFIGESLERSWRARGKASSTSRSSTIGLGIVSLVGLAWPIAMWILSPDHEGLIARAGAIHLSNLPESLIASNFVDWVLRDGFTMTTFTVVWPMLALVPAIWLCTSAATTLRERAAQMIGLGAAIVALGLACFRLQAWSLADALLLVLLCPAAAAFTRERRTALAWSVCGLGVIVSVACGLRLIIPGRDQANGSVTELEAQALIERDLSQWLARRVGSGGAVVLAPPSLTVSCLYHGGLRGLATPYLGNGDGFAAAIRIAAASSPDEAQALVQRRRVTHIIMPSWDSSLDEYARLGANQPENTLIGLLHRWLPPRWLRPVAYNLPKLAGFETQSVAVFEVVDVQDNASAVARIAEYFAEVGDRDQAAAAARALAKLYPDDQNALLAQVEVAMALGERQNFLELVKALDTNLSENGDETLSWDRRLSLAIVLANAERPEPAREQLRRCLSEIDETHLRTLSTVALYRMQLLLRFTGEKIEDPKLAALARRLLPSEMREGL